MVVNSYVTFVTEFWYFFFDCGYLNVAMYRFVGNIPRPNILEFLIGIIEKCLCWNYSLFPIVGSHRSKQVLVWLYIALFYSACLSYSVCQWVSRICLVLISVVWIYLRWNLSWLRICSAFERVIRLAIFTLYSLFISLARNS